MQSVSPSYYDASASSDGAGSVVHAAPSRIPLDVEVPLSWLSSDLDGERHRMMFAKLCAALADRPVDVQMKPVAIGMHEVPRAARPGGMVLSYHSIGDEPNVWRIKDTSVPGWYSFDRYGFSGWSSLARFPEEHEGRIEAIDLQLAEAKVIAVREFMRRGNLSKYKQSQDSFTPGRPYVYFPLQRVDDTVAAFFRLDTIEVLYKAAELAEKTGILLVVKRHPLCNITMIAEALADLQANFSHCVLVSNASIHSQIEGCRAVLVANSGVGIEALLYTKPVFTFGASEYEYATHVINTLDEIEAAFAPTLPDNSARALRFMYYYLNDYCFSIFDHGSLEKRIDMALRSVADMPAGALNLDMPVGGEMTRAYRALESLRMALAETKAENGHLRRVSQQALELAQRASEQARTPVQDRPAPVIVDQPIGHSHVELEELKAMMQSTVQILQDENAVLKDKLSLLQGVFPTDQLPEKLPHEFDGFFANRALYKLLKDFAFETVLDIGSGEGKQAAVMLRHGKSVTALDYGKSPYYQWRDPAIKTVIGDFNTMEFESQYDCVWASHVLEHQPNPHAFLRKVNEVTREGGIVAISVPPLKHQIVGGHLSLWNGGMLLYHMVVAGFDCSEASILQYGYNISIIVKKREIPFPNIVYDMGDIRAIREYLPKNIEFRPSQHDDPFDGDILKLNW